MWRAKIFVTLKKSVLDPEGEAVKSSLHTMGYSEVEQVRIGKLIEVQMRVEDRETAAEKVKVMAERLLANLEIENYRFELEEVKA